MKNRTLLTIVLSLAAVMLFLIMLSSGRDTLTQRQEALTASAEVAGESAADSVAAVDDEAMNPETPLALKYSRYPLTFVYFVVNQESIPVYSSPNDDKRVIRTAENREKLNYVETVRMQGGAAGPPGSGSWVGSVAGPPGSRSVAPAAAAVSAAEPAAVSAAEPAAVPAVRTVAETLGDPAAGAAAGPSAAPGGRIWYHVYWYENEKGEVLADGSVAGAEKRFGFIPEGSAEKRRLCIDDMAEYVRRAGDFTSGGGVTCIVNYQNGHGKPPQYRGKDTDAQGNQRSQSAPGYPEPAAGEEFTYLPDGTMVKVLEPLAASGVNAAGTGGGYRRVRSLADGKEYYVPLKYIPDTEALTALTKTVVIDRANQNEAVFEKTEEGWVCVSYTLATTGTKSQYAVPTPLGYFVVMEKRPQFYYIKDGTTQIQGYAPYVLRFCGGAYVHGTAVSYEYKDGKRITPPKKEFSPTLGTVPLSHKCVRNYTSHAEFLYNWYEAGKTAVIVME